MYFSVHPIERHQLNLELIDCGRILGSVNNNKKRWQLTDYIVKEYWEPPPSNTLEQRESFIMKVFSHNYDSKIVWVNFKQMMRNVDGWFTFHSVSFVAFVRRVKASDNKDENIPRTTELTQGGKEIIPVLHTYLCTIVQHLAAHNL